MACSKESFLNQKPDQGHLVPSKLTDLQAILDQDQYMNGAAFSGGGPIPALGEIAADSYYVLDQDFFRLPEVYRNAYVWNKDIFVAGMKPIDWDLPYQSIFYANVVLDNLATMNFNDGESSLFNNVKGSALFYRAHAFYQLAQVFAPPYDPQKATELLGIPLRLTADVGERIYRSSLDAVYKRIADDLQEALKYLPDFPLVKTRPSKWAAYGLLARVYQTMLDYPQAELYADKYLDVKNDLLDFNSLDSTASYPFANLNNEEIAFACNMLGLGASNYPLWHSYYALVDSALYKQYHTDDLRKYVQFKRTDRGVVYKGSYEGTDVNFAGIATDEVMLIKAECLAERGEVEQGLIVLNRLLETRFKEGSYIPYIANNQTEALDIIKSERRKELLFRGLRWTDIRRYNLEGDNIRLQRNVDGKEYVLEPNNARYTYPIPMEVLSFYEDMEQNTR